jgi:hypothetical protein
VVERSLDDIRYHLNPTFATQEIARLDKVSMMSLLQFPATKTHGQREGPIFGTNSCSYTRQQDVTWARTLDGSEYMPGLVGLNDMRANDYANVIIEVGGMPCTRSAQRCENRVLPGAALCLASTCNVNWTFLVAASLLSSAV